MGEWREPLGCVVTPQLWFREFPEGLRDGAGAPRARGALGVTAPG